MKDNDLFTQALSQLGKPAAAPTQPTQVVQPQEQPTAKPEVATGGDGANFLDGAIQATSDFIRPLNDALAASGAGIAKAGFEVKDAIVGEPAKPSAFRQLAEDTAKRTGEVSGLYSAITGISQFATGMVGLGRLAAAGRLVKGGAMVAKVIAKGGKAARLAAESARGAAAGALVFDPQDPRLSNWVESNPSLSNPLSRYLQAKPGDSAAEGRFKNALEGIGLDVVAIGTVVAAGKAISYMRGGDAKAAAKWAEVSAEGEGQGRVANVQVADEGPAPRTVGETMAIQADKIEITVARNQTEALKKGKKLKPTVKFKEGDVDGILNDVEEYSAALATYGSHEAALNAGVKLKSTKLPYQMMNTSDDLEDFMGVVAQRAEAQIDTAKGGAVVSDARMGRLIQQRVNLYGEDPGEVLGMLQQAGNDAATLAANMETASALSIKMADDAYKVAAKIKIGDLSEWGGSLTAAKAEVVKRFSLSMTTLAASRSMLSNAGRTMRRARGDLRRLSAKQIRDIESMGVDEMVDLLDSTGGDVGAITNIINKPKMITRVIDGATFLLVNNLLWGWKTQVVNTAMNTYMLYARPAEKALGASVQQALGVSGASAMRKQALREYWFMSFGLVDSFRSASEAIMQAGSFGSKIKAAGSAGFQTLAKSAIGQAGRTARFSDSMLSPHTVEAHQATARAGVGDVTEVFKDLKDGDLLGGATKGTLVALGLPVRGLGTLDELVKQVRYRSVVATDAAMRADELGLVGQEAKAFISKELDGAFDEAGQALNAEALQEAKITTFTQKLLSDTAGATVQYAVSKHPNSRFILPFVTTPTNVLRYGIKLTPGLSLAQKEYRNMFRGLLGKERQAQAYGQMALGTLFMTAAGTLVLDGKITGTGPKDFKRRKALMATGWKPNSIITKNDDGTTTYFPYNRFDPVGLPIGVIADGIDIMSDPSQTGKTEAVALALGIALTNQITDKTYLRNLNEFIRFASDPEKTASRFLGQMAANMVPAASMLRQVNPDPLMREARDMTDFVMKTIPGLSEDLPPQYDAWGDPITVKRGLWSNTKEDAVDAEMVRMGLDADQGLSPPSPYGTGYDLRAIKIEDGRTAFEAIQQYAGHPKGAPSLKKAVLKVMKTSAYQKAADGSGSTRGTKMWLIQSIVGKYRSAAKKRLQAESQIYRDTIQEAELAARAAFTKETGPKPNPVLELLDGYGIDTESLRAPTSPPTAPIQ